MDRLTGSFGPSETQRRAFGTGPAGKRRAGSSGARQGLGSFSIDRSRPWKMAGYKLKDIIFSPMAASGLRNAGGGVTSDLINFALIQGMIIVGGLGTPTIEENLAITTLQKYKLKEFLGKDEIDELGGKIAFNQGKRVAELILGLKK